MSKPVKFTLENDELLNRPTDSLRAAAESFVYQPDIFSYLEKIYEKDEYSHILSDLVDLKHDIEYTIGSRGRHGEAFLDGGMLALDAVGTFAPDLIDGLHDELMLARFDRKLEYMSSDDVTDEDERAYLKAVLLTGEDLISDYATEYGKIIFDTRIARNYKTKEHTIDLTHGFTYVMYYAGAVYQKDLAAFTREVRDEIKPVEVPHRIKVPLSLMAAIDKELQKKSEGWTSQPTE